jgi:hypothetical protein
MVKLEEEEDPRGSHARSGKGCPLFNITESNDATLTGIQRIDHRLIRDLCV